MYSFESRVRYSECDETGELTLSAMMNYLQDCSTFQCEDAPGGMAELGRRRLGWILGTWEIEVLELPRFGEKIKAITWCYSMRGLQALRNFTLTRPDGAPLVRADSQWFLYDLAAGRVIRVPEDQRFYLEDTPRLDMPALPRKVGVEGTGEEASHIEVSEQLLDSNNHVNNAQYVRLAADAAAELGHAVKPHRLTVQYRTMARLGDIMVPHVHACEDGFAVSLASEAGDPYAVVKLQGR